MTMWMRKTAARVRGPSDLPVRYLNSGRARGTIVAVADPFSLYLYNFGMRVLLLCARAGR